MPKMSAASSGGWGLKRAPLPLKSNTRNFQQATRSRTLKKPTQSSETILQEADALLQHYPLTRPKVRLIGVGASHFVPAKAPIQADLFAEKSKPPANWEKVDHAVDAINERFGSDVIRKASPRGWRPSQNNAPREK